MRTEGKWRFNFSLKQLFAGDKGKIVGTYVYSDDAEFICLAVNSHDKLVDLVKRANFMLSNTGKGTIGETFHKDAEKLLKEVNSDL
jgi:hypothetical protein